ncbi:MAG: hypothetical protein OXL41_13200 [Nitrospinae bacterium]|nr:hypothetical protein [Nitrospinota bacterium]
MRIALAIFLVTIILFGCGGGGGPKFSSTNAPNIRQITGMSTPTFSDSEIAPALDAQLEAVQASGDGLLLVSDWYVRIRDNLSGQVAALTIDTTCDQSGCVAVHSQSGIYERFTLHDFGEETYPASSQRERIEAVGEKNGVRVVTSFSFDLEGEDIDMSAELYGAWMVSNGFGVLWGNSRFNEGSIESGFGYSIGAMSRSLPLGNTTYNGLMVGVDTGANRGDQIQGDAKLDFKLNFPPHERYAPNMNVFFSNIRNLRTGASYRNIEWTDGSVAENGTFDWGSINGSFYGPNHEEVGGSFNRNGIAGAFGGKR